MTYEQLKQLVAPMLCKATYDSDKVMDILKKVQT